MLTYLTRISIILFVSFCSLYSIQTASDSLRPVTVIDTLTKTGVDASKYSPVDSTQNESANKLIKVDNLIPDEEVKNKLTDIFSASKIIWAIIFLLISFFFIRLVTRILDKLSEKSTKYRIALKGTIPIVRIFSWTFVLSIVVTVIFAPPVESLVVVTGSLGLAIGFASQDILKNIFGGIMILFDRPFQVGDKIEAGQYYGEVVKIGLRSTRIVTADDSLVSIPNGDIMTRSVSNSNTGEANCQVVAEIYLPITVDTEKVRQIATEAAQVSKYIYLDKPIAVLFFNEVKERRSYFKMRLKAYVMDIRYEFSFKSDMTELVIKELLKQKIISPSDFQ